MERQLMLLGILRAQKMHGYQLNDFLEKHYDFVTDLKPSTAYYLLEKLASDGYVEMHQEQVGNRPQRRVFQITPKGEAYFIELLRANLRDHAKPTYADEVGLTFLRELPAEEISSYLIEKRQALQGEFDHLGRVAETLRADGSQPVSLTLDHHLTMVRAELDWLDRLLTGIRAKESEAL